MLLLAACQMSLPTDSNPNSPPDTTGTPGDTTGTPPDTTVTPPDTLTPDSSVWDTTGIRFEEVGCDVREALLSYDPLGYKREWVYLRTMSGEQTDTRYEYRMLDHWPMEDVLLLRIRRSPSLASVRSGSGESYFYWHGSFGSYALDDTLGGRNLLPNWALYCFCAAQPGDTLHAVVHTIHGDTVRAETAVCIGWDETVELPDTTYTGCYAAVIDTLVENDSLSWHRRVTRYYKAGIGLVKEVNDFSNGDIQQTIRLEYKPPLTWPWYYPIPTTPGQPGEAILSYYPLGDGYSWDYLTYNSTTASDSGFIRNIGDPPELVDGAPTYPVQGRYAAIEDSAEIMDHPSDTRIYAYNGNNVLRHHRPEDPWEALPVFFHFPDVHAGQVLFDSSYSDWINYWSDRVVVVSTDRTVTVPAGTFTNVYQVQETRSESSQMSSSSSVKNDYFAPGVGLIKQTNASTSSRGGGETMVYVNELLRSSTDGMRATSDRNAGGR